MIREQDLIYLGFQKAWGDQFYYYTYDLLSGVSLITSTDDEVINNEWEVEFFNTDKVKITSVDMLIDLLDIFEKIKNAQ